MRVVSRLLVRIGDWKAMVGGERFNITANLQAADQFTPVSARYGPSLSGPRGAHATCKPEFLKMHRIFLMQIAHMIVLNYPF